jgi:hypothetical protein
MILEPAPAPQPVRKGRLRRLPGAELQKRTYVATDDDNTGETVYVRGPGSRGNGRASDSRSARRRC